MNFFFLRNKDYVHRVHLKWSSMSLEHDVPAVTVGNCQGYSHGDSVQVSRGGSSSQIICAIELPGISPHLFVNENCRTIGRNSRGQMSDVARSIETHRDKPSEIHTHTAATHTHTHTHSSCKRRCSQCQGMWPGVSSSRT